MYALKEELDAERDPSSGRWRVREDALARYVDDPPPGRRPRAPVNGADPDAGGVLARLDGLEADVRQLRQATPVVTPDPDLLAVWRRRALVAEHALGEVGNMAGLYEEVLDAETQARALDERATAVRADARAALLSLLRAYRQALQMLSTPVDASDLGGP